MQFYVYALARPVDRIFYIGKGSKHRVFAHENAARNGHKCHRCNIIRKVWQEGGEIQHYILLTTEDEQEAFEYEKEMIALHGRENLCNQTDGGDGVRNLTAEARARISAANRAREHRRGYHRSEETKRKISVAHTGRIIKPEWIEKMRAALTGKKLNCSPEERQRRADTIKRVGTPFQKGTPAYNKGISPSEETRAKIAAGVKANPKSYGRKMSESTRDKCFGALAEYRRQHAAVYQLIDPSGEMYKTSNLKQFCADHALKYEQIAKVVHNIGRYRGWRIKRVDSTSDA